MLYSETELKKRLKSGCPVFYFYASDEALVRSAAAKAEKFLSEEAPDTTTLDEVSRRLEEDAKANEDKASFVNLIFLLGLALGSPPSVRTSAQP